MPQLRGNKAVPRESPNLMITNVLMTFFQQTFFTCPNFTYCVKYLLDDLAQNLLQVSFIVIRQ